MDRQGLIEVLMGGARCPKGTRKTCAKPKAKAKPRAKKGRGARGGCLEEGYGLFDDSLRGYGLTGDFMEEGGAKRRNCPKGERKVCVPYGSKAPKKAPTKRKPSEYNKFVKKYFHQVQKQLAHGGMPNSPKDVIRELAAEWRSLKAEYV